MKEIITMSIKETSRISVLEKLKQKEIKQGKAARIMGVSVRQVRRLLKNYKKDGASGIIHKLRGLPGNNMVDQKILDQAVTVFKTKYPDFSITLAHEKLTIHHGFPYGRETLRKTLISVGLWHPVRYPKPIIHELRERRAAEGELVQIDGSPHAWFEDRGPSCTLLVYIDDATGKLLHLELVTSESINAYFISTRHYLEKYGKPLAFYSDKHGVFRVNTTKGLSASVDDSNGLTQFGRAMRELDIEMIFANSPQAKGRVERVNQTLQDRLVKELRLKGISTINEANQYLPEFTEDFNRRFAVTSKSQVNMHRQLTSNDNLDEILLQKHNRILSKQLTLSYESQIYQITTERPIYAMRHAPVTVQEDSAGTITVVYKKQKLDYRIIQKQPKSYIVDTKHINQTVDGIVNRIWVKPEPTHPWKQPYLYW